MPETPTNGNAQGRVIDMHDICRIYPMGDTEVRALDGVSLRVRRGEFVAVMGPSGSGKSTLMNMLGCLDTPTAGHYELNGHAVESLDDDTLAEIRNQEIGFIFQTFNLLPRLTALGNVELPLAYSGIGPAERKQLAETTLESVGLAERMHHRPDQLSGGQRQRVAVARALVHGPSLLLADEPTGNLDTETSGEIMELLSRVHAQGNTIVLVTHEPDIAGHAQRLIGMRDGQIEKDVVQRA